jgi:microcystin-dependent protein
MHKIDGPGATDQNQFTQGNPANGTPATVVTPEWLTAVQEELVNVLSEAGVAPSKPDNTQLYQAIQILINAAAQFSGMSTGDCKPTFKNVADPGWILVNDGTIGPSGSGATTRANDDTEALYKLLWANVTDTHAPVTGGRGATADQDWGNAKLLAVPKALGRALAIAGTGASLSARSLGQALGTETHLLTGAQSGEKGHTHLTIADTNEGGAAPPLTNGRPLARQNSSYALGGSNSPATVGLTTEAETEDADEAHPNVQPSVFLNFMVKL